MTREELLRSKEYWIGEIQFDLFKKISEFMEQNGLSRKELAERLGVTKGYVSQILNGEFDHRISKLVELSLSVGKVPRIEFEDIEQILLDDLYDLLDTPKNQRPIVNLQISPTSHIDLSRSHTEYLTVTNNSEEQLSSQNYYSFKEASYEKETNCA